MIRKLASGVLLAAALPAVAAAAPPSTRLTPTPAAGQTLGVVGGKPTLVSAAGGNEALLVLKKEIVPARDVPIFQLAIHNGGGQPLDVILTDIVVTTDAGPVHVLSLGELEAQSRADLERALRNSSRTASGQETAYRQMRSSMAVASAPNAYSKPEISAHDQLMDNGSDTLAAQRAAYAVRVAHAMAEAAAFKPLKADPGANVATGVALSLLPRKATKLTLVVTIEGQAHTFDYALKPAS